MSEEIEYKITLTIWYKATENNSLKIVRDIRAFEGVTSILLLAKTELAKRDNIKKFEYPDLTRGL